MALKLTGLAGTGFGGLGKRPSERALIRMEVESKAFDRWFQRYMLFAGHYHEDMLRKTAFDMIRGIMKNTPVDTGRARMAWSGLHKIHNKRQPFSRKETATFKDQQRGWQEARATDRSDAKFFNNPYAPNTGYSHVFIEITNPVNYILYLEAGHSKQSQPGAMIAANLARFKNAYRKAMVKRVLARANKNAHK